MNLEKPRGVWRPRANGEMRPSEAAEPARAVCVRCVSAVRIGRRWAVVGPLLSVNLL